MTKKLRVGLAIFTVIAIAGGVAITKKDKSSGDHPVKKMNPFYGEIHNYVSTTGTVLPQNRLEVKPSINGRVEQILVVEGDDVHKGQTLAFMSSTERAALLDAARAQGPEAVKYWQEVYKDTPLLAPIDGEVIVKSVEPGQAITTNDPVVVLSDRLIVKAQFDETDIGKIKVGQSSNISLDAYPDIKLAGRVNHISYESKLVNNVNIYEVDILPIHTPPVFRSGMSTNVDVLLQGKQRALLVPLEAVKQDKDGSYVLLDKGQKGKPVRQKIELGITNDTNAEVVSGLTPDDKIIIQNSQYKPVQSGTRTGGNPFMPTRRAH